VEGDEVGHREADGQRRGPAEQAELQGRQVGAEGNVIRMIAWVPLLGRNGLVNDTLMSLGVIRTPIEGPP
jgi:hypothetical protein